MDPNAVIAHYAAKLVYTEAELQKAAHRIQALEKDVEEMSKRLGEGSETPDQTDENP